MFGGKPFFCPVDQIMVKLREDATPDVAVRVHDFTPFFSELITLRPALTALLTTENDSCDEEGEGDAPASGEDDTDEKQQIEKPSDNELRDYEARAMLLNNVDWGGRWHPDVKDYAWTGEEWQLPCAALAVYIEHVLQSIPDSMWSSKTRNNVRPHGQDSCDQLTLGLISCATYGRVPMMSSATWKLPNLVRLILMYFERLGEFCEPIICTSIQMSRNVQSRLHVDKNNQGMSFITGLGSFEGGETFFYSIDEQAPDAYIMTEKIAGWSNNVSRLRGHNQVM